ncbi:MAG: ABC transporter permease [Acidimicrobiia bacterium]
MISQTSSNRLSVAFSILSALVIGAVVIALSGTNPLLAYQEMVDGALTGSGLRNTVARMIPIVGMGLALSIPFRAGVINLGGEGQMVLGGLAGTLTAIYLPGPPPLVMVASVLAGAVAGSFWAFLAAAGQIWLKLPILISSLLLAYPARAITSYLVRFPFADPTVTSSSTVPVPNASRIPKLPLFGGVSASIILLALFLVAIAIFNQRTVAGYETRMTGLNSRFSRYGGVGVDRQVVWVMVASGAISGVIGTHLVVGETYRFLDGDLVVTGFAWTGLLVTLLASHRPLPMLAAGAFFAALQIGGLAMQRNVNVPWQIALVLQAVVIVVLASRYVLGWRQREQPDEVPMVEGELTVTGEV